MPGNGTRGDSDGLRIPAARDTEGGARQDREVDDLGRLVLRRENDDRAERLHRGRLTRSARRAGSDGFGPVPRSENNVTAGVHRDQQQEEPLQQRDLEEHEPARERQNTRASPNLSQDPASHEQGQRDEQQTACGNAPQVRSALGVSKELERRTPRRLIAQRVVWKKKGDRRCGRDIGG